MNDAYILEGKNAIRTDIMTWAKWNETANKTVKKTKVDYTYNGVLSTGATVSTIFLGLDHGYREDPLIFETMVFGGPLDQKMATYSTWEEAEIGHDKMVEELKNGANQDDNHEFRASL